ncbi:hypothetical protein HK102_013015, partial [Quaeritorhiza haematococci]
MLSIDTLSIHTPPPSIKSATSDININVTALSTATATSTINDPLSLDYKAICPIHELKPTTTIQEPPLIVPTGDDSSEEGSSTDGDSNSDSGTSNDDVDEFQLTQHDTLATDDPTAAWRDGRPAFYYPSDPRLPWHFCWIDDGMVGGMSAP